eukprot:1781251-Rhodomonas_salina.2
MKSLKMVRPLMMMIIVRVPHPRAAGSGRGQPDPFSRPPPLLAKCVMSASELSQRASPSSARIVTASAHADADGTCKLDSLWHHPSRLLGATYHT